MTEKYKSVVIEGLNWAEKNKYCGYSKFDALNSPMLEFISKNSRLIRGAFIYLNSRMPINIRPILLVKKYQNPKGLALFIRSYFNLYNLSGDKIYFKKAIELIDILLSISQVKYFSGHCWGYDHPWQNKAFFAKRYYPNTVVTVFVCEALLDAYNETKDKEYLKIIKSVCKFISDDLHTIINNDKYLCSSYIPNNDYKVINVNGLIGSLFSRIFKVTNDRKYYNNAKKYINWVISTQTDYGAWYYTEPPHKSPITHDNYHTGFILDSIYEYMDNTNDQKFLNQYKFGLEYYKNNLFTKKFAPKWMYDKKYPHDIHGVAQGIITFSKASKYNDSYINLAENIARWGIKNLYNDNGRFFYQKGKYITKNFTLMRWCQAWMSFALSSYLYKIHKKNNN